MRARFEWTSKEERQSIVDEAVGLLERVGMDFGHGDALETLAEAGAEVDRERGVARIPTHLVEEALALCPREILLAGATPAHDCLLGEGVAHFTNSGSPPQALDFETGVRRSSTLDDLGKATMLLDTACTAIMWAICTATDLPESRRMLAELIPMLSWTQMHVQHEVEGRWQLEAFKRMGEVAGDDPRSRPRLSIVCCTSSPLHAHSELLDTSTDVVAMGYPVVVLPMPIGGATAPLTIAGMAT